MTAIMKSKSFGRFLAILMAVAIMIGAAGLAEDIGMEQEEQISSEDKGAEQGEPVSSEDRGAEQQSGEAEKKEPATESQAPEADSSDEGVEAEGSSAEREEEQNVAASGAEGEAKGKGDVMLDARALSLVEGQTWRLHAVTFDKAALHWSSNNAGVASVDANGLVMANSPGSSTIYAAIEGGKRASCEVTVFPIE